MSLADEDRAALDRTRARCDEQRTGDRAELLKLSEAAISGPWITELSDRVASADVQSISFGGEVDRWRAFVCSTDSRMESEPGRMAEDDEANAQFIVAAANYVRTYVATEPDQTRGTVSLLRRVADDPHLLLRIADTPHLVSVAAEAMYAVPMPRDLLEHELGHAFRAVAEHLSGSPDEAVKP